MKTTIYNPKQPQYKQTTIGCHVAQMNAPDWLTYFTELRKEDFLRNDKNAVENSNRKFSLEILTCRS